jgi:hypothetical protein
MAERGLRVNHSRLARLVLRYARFSANECGAICSIRIVPGGWTKPTFAWQASGPIYIEPWIRRAIPSISFSRHIATGGSQALPTTCLGEGATSSAARHQRGWTSRLPVRHCRMETNRPIAEILSLPISLLEQFDRARPPLPQETNRCQPGFSFRRRSTPYNPRL